MHPRASIVALFMLLAFLLAAPILPHTHEHIQALHAQAQPPTIVLPPGPIGTPDSNRTPVTSQTDAALPELALEVLGMINAARVNEGCPALAENAILTRVALEHSIDMAHSGNFGHRDSSGQGPGTRIHNAGYNWSWYAENIAVGYNTPVDVLTAWIGSEGHRQNILNCNLRDIGVGVYYLEDSPYRIYWTTDFGTRDGDDSPMATETPTPTTPPTDQPTATPTMTPSPTPDPLATPTPEPTPIPIPGPFKYLLPAVQGVSAPDQVTE